MAREARADKVGSRDRESHMAQRELNAIGWSAEDWDLALEERVERMHTYGDPCRCLGLRQTATRYIARRIRSVIRYDGNELIELEPPFPLA